MPRSRVICVWGPSFLSASPTPYPISPLICLGSGFYYRWFCSPTWPGLPATGPNMNSTGCLIVNSIYANSNPCWQTAVYLPSDPLYISHSCLIYENCLYKTDSLSPEIYYLLLYYSNDPAPHLLPLHFRLFCEKCRHIYDGRGVTYIP